MAPICSQLTTKDVVCKICHFHITAKDLKVVPQCVEMSSCPPVLQSVPRGCELYIVVISLLLCEVRCMRCCIDLESCAQMSRDVELPTGAANHFYMMRDVHHCHQFAPGWTHLPWHPYQCWEGFTVSCISDGAEMTGSAGRSITLCP